MQKPIFHYDETGDSLTISFSPGEKSTGIELNDSILLCINKQEQRAVSITIFNYSFLAQQTNAGLRSLPLTGLSELSDELKDMVLKILNRAPIKDILALSTYSPSLTENIPISSLQPALLAAA